MLVQWKAWVDSSGASGASEVGRRLRKLAFEHAPNFIVEPARDEGFVLSWEVESTSPWNDTVVATISTGQRLGRGWVLVGDVRSSPEGVLSKSGGGKISVPGVTMISWTVLPLSTSST